MIWHRHLGFGDSKFHLGNFGPQSFATHCFGQWSVNDAVETHDDPPADQRCGWCERLDSETSNRTRHDANPPGQTLGRLDVSELSWNGWET